VRYGCRGGEFMGFGEEGGCVAFADFEVPVCAMLVGSSDWREGDRLRDLLVLPKPPPGFPPAGPGSGCFTRRASMYSCTAPRPSALSAAGIVFSLFLSRRLNCITSYFSLFSLSSCVPLTVPLVGLSLLDTQLAMPASGWSRHMFAYMAVKRALWACSRAGVVRILESVWESSSWLRLPRKKNASDFLYVVQSASLMAPFTAEYSGSTSTRGVRGAMGFLLRSVWTLRPGREFEESVGVVAMFISFGRMVPAIAAECMRRWRAQCVGLWCGRASI
jgi:hypothetical protein